MEGSDGGRGSEARVREVIGVGGGGSGVRGRKEEEEGWREMIGEEVV